MSEGKNKKDIIKLFGKPSKVFTFIDKEIITYYMDEFCLHALKSKGTQIGFTFESLGVVSLAYSSPPMQMRPKNE